MRLSPEQDQMFDYIIIGSGFGGSVSALRLSQKGYKVLVIEKGRWWKSSDFPKTNWNLRKWLWLPMLRFYGFFKITFVRHVCILSGVGVITVIIIVGIPILIFWTVWVIIRCVKGMKRLDLNEAQPNPGGWMFD